MIKEEKRSEGSEKRIRTNKKKCTCNIVYVLINDDVHALVGFFVSGNVLDGEGFRHDSYERA
jgi:hypothetical protein